MDIESINEGDMIVVDMNMLAEEVDIHPPFDELEIFRGEVKGINYQGDVKIVGKLKDNGINPEDHISSEAQGEIPPETIIEKYEECPSCGKLKSYYDKEDRWICLSCERDELE